MAALTEERDDGGVPSAAEFGQEARWGARWRSCGAI
jgi:hypothetical protein